MDRLPLEIYNQITSYLTCSEKQRLLLVCRYWHNTIKNGNLFNNFSTKGYRKFEAAALFFKENESHGKQVRSLRLVKPEADLDYILAIPERFPLLQDFVWANYGTTANYIDKEKIGHWRNIIHFGEINCYPLSTEILKLGGFCNINRLVINLHFSNSDCSPLINQLSNAPKLQHLNLSSGKMTLLDLELLHNNVPQLKTLCLTDIMQEENEAFDIHLEEQRLEAVNVARDLTSLQMRNMKIPEGGFVLLNSWMAYMAVAYCHIKQLTIDGVGMTRGRQDYYETKLADIVAGCPHLKSYKVNIFPITASILTAMDGNKVQLKRIDVIDDPSVDQIHLLLDSGQSHSLEIITMNDTRLDYATLLFSALEGFPKLKHVEVGNKIPQSISLDVVFQKLKGLETLKLSTWNIGLVGSHASLDNIQTKLRCLVLEKVVLNNSDNMDVMSFMSRACPDLSKLSIQGQVEGGQSVFRVEFPRHYFTLIKLDFLSNEYYKVNIHNHHQKSTWYKFRGRRQLDSFPDSNAISKDQPHVSIECKGTASLNIGGTDIPNW